MQNEDTPPHDGRRLQIGDRVKGALAFALTLAAVPSAFAQGSSPLAQGLLDLPANDSPSAHRYATPDGRVRFVMDRSSGERLALVRFEGADEVHVLHAVPGPRGDEFFKTDTGDILLRVTAVGGVIVYTDGAMTGAPVTSAGASRPMPPPAPPPGGLRARIETLSRDVANRLGRAVAFEAPSDARGEASGVVADAAARAAEGLASSPPQAVRVDRVVIRYGAQPGAVVVNQSLNITVSPQMGYAGRPSSTAVARAVSGGGPGPVVETAGGFGPRRR